MFKIKIIYISILLYLFIFSLIYQSGSVRAALLCDGFLFYTTRILLLGIPLFLIFMYRGNNRCLSFVLPIVYLGIIFVAINYILYPDGAIQFLYKILILIMSMLVYHLMIRNSIDINRYIYNVIIAIALITLCFYCAVELAKISIPYSTVYFSTSYRYHNYFDLFFTYHYSQFIPRLSGLFWEPGAYQIYLNIALFIYVFDRKNNKKELAILLLSILFVQSTVGYCIAVLLLAVLLSNIGVFTRKSKAIVGGVGLVSALVAGCFIVYQKVQETSGYPEGSAVLRFADLTNGIAVFFNHPIFGTGFGNNEEFILLDSFGRASSNGLLSYAYMTGFIGLIFAFVPFINNYFHCRDKKRQACWIIIMILVNCGEPIYNLPIMAFVLGVEYTKMLKIKSLNMMENLKINAR